MTENSQTPEIRLGRISDLTVCQEIERSAGKIFLDRDMDEIANDEPLPLSELAVYCDEHRLWVAVDGLDQPIAYIILDIVDNRAHIEQVSVHENHAGRKIGRSLIDKAVSWASEQHMDAVTLTTFRDIPWNAPYYERCGFVVIAEENLLPGLQKVRSIEASHGLERWPRVCMQRFL